jgi:two-component system, chemotaxis family, chemotaxis protein CheY
VVKILIVDDSRSARFFLRSCIPKEGVQVSEAENGEEGVAKYRELRPDLVFMDLTMPIMDGFEAVRTIRELDGDARIIVLTADVQKRTMDRISQLGVVDFLKKPPRKEPVLEALRKAFPEGLST